MEESLELEGFKMTETMSGGGNATIIVIVNGFSKPPNLGAIV